MKFKKILFLLLLIVIILGVFFFIYNSSKVNELNTDISKSSSSKKNNEIIELKEDYFITQINDMYLNPDEYVGKTIIIEGFPLSYLDEKFVGRFGPRMLCGRWLCLFRIYF